MDMIILPIAVLLILYLLRKRLRKRRSQVSGWFGGSSKED